MHRIVKFHRIAKDLSRRSAQMIANALRNFSKKISVNLDQRIVKRLFRIIQEMRTLLQADGTKSFPGLVNPIRSSAVREVKHIWLQPLQQPINGQFMIRMRKDHPGFVQGGGVQKRYR